MVGLGGDLLRWYNLHKRELPWRKTKDPYAIWLSEIILQQTRIDQGLSYYLKFMEKYPTVIDLAYANEDDILKLWQGLGYYSRARNLHVAARTVADVYHGKFPDNYKELIKLKGIGDYTAAAIVSISFNQPYAVVDGNVFRFLSRLYGISTPIDTQAGKKEFTKLANAILDRENPGEYNQAVMEFGALFCTPKSPRCNSCIFNSRCVAFQNASVNKLPVKSGKQKIRLRYFNYLLIRDHDYTYISKRTANDIWKNLYEFPLIETEEKTEVTDLEKHLIRFLGHEHVEINKITTWQKQILSHQCIYYRFIYIQASDKKYKLPGLLKVNKKDILNFAVPKPIEKELDHMNWVD
ncbi:MAG: A/G-specific adenine glycosylase [Mangrovibacterium sp.]